MLVVRANKFLQSLLLCLAIFVVCEVVFPEYFVEYRRPRDSQLMLIIQFLIVPPVAIYMSLGRWVFTSEGFGWEVGLFWGNKRFARFICFRKYAWSECNIAYTTSYSISGLILVGAQPNILRYLFHDYVEACQFILLNATAAKISPLARTHMEDMVALRRKNRRNQN